MLEHTRKKTKDSRVGTDINRLWRKRCADYVAANAADEVDEKHAERSCGCFDAGANVKLDNSDQAEVNDAGVEKKRRDEAPPLGR